MSEPRCVYQYPDLAKCWLPPAAHEWPDAEHDADWRPHAFVHPDPPKAEEPEGGWTLIVCLTCGTRLPSENAPCRCLP